MDSGARSPVKDGLAASCRGVATSVGFVVLLEELLSLLLLLLLLSVLDSAFDLARRFRAATVSRTTSLLDKWAEISFASRVDDDDDLRGKVADAGKEGDEFGIVVGEDDDNNDDADDDAARVDTDDDEEEEWIEALDRVSD